MTLGCLPHYRHWVVFSLKIAPGQSTKIHPQKRRLGVGLKLLEYILKTAKEDGCARATLHVQTNNELALKFYEKGGFTVTETVPGYYKNIEPTDAHVLEKEL